MMNDMPQFMIYLAGPIDGVTGDEANGWRDQIVNEFPNILFFLPNRAYGNANPHNASKMHHMNRHGIECSHGLVANLTGHGRGFGTIREIEFARGLEKHVVVAVASDIDHETLMTYDCELAADPIEAVTKMLEWFSNQLGRERPPGIMGFLFPGGNVPE